MSENNAVFSCSNCGKIPLMSIVNDDIPKIHYLCNFCLKDTTVKIKEFLDKNCNSKEKHQCSRCNQHDAKKEGKMFCLQCQKWFCDNCLEMHNEFSIDHIVVPCEIKIETKCNKHNNKDIEFFCEECRKNICLFCLDEEHQKHKVSKLKTVYNNSRFFEFKEDLAKAQEKVRQYNKDIKDRLVDVLNQKIIELNNEVESVENAYKENNIINEELLQMVEILYYNYKLTDKCPNYYIMMNLLNNSTFNLSKCDYNINQTPEENRQILINYYKSDFIFPKAKHDLSTLECLNTSQEEQSIKSLLVIDKNRIACCSSSSDIKIFNISTFQCSLVLEGHKDTVQYITQYDKNTLVSSSKDKSIIIWTVLEDNFAIIATLTGHEASVYKVIKLSNGNLASCSYDKSIKIWKGEKPYSCIATLASDNKNTNIDSILELNNGKLISNSCSDDTVTFWDLKNEKIEYTINKISSSSSANALLEINRNKVVICGYKVVTIVNGDNYNIEKKIAVNDGGNIRSIAMLTMNMLVVGGYCNLCQIDLITGECNYKKEKAHNNLINSIVVQDCNLISCSEDKTIKKWKW